MLSMGPRILDPEEQATKNLLSVEREIPFAEPSMTVKLEVVEDSIGRVPGCQSIRDILM